MGEAFSKNIGPSDKKWKEEAETDLTGSQMKKNLPASRKRRSFSGTAKSKDATYSVGRTRTFTYFSGSLSR